MSKIFIVGISGGVGSRLVPKLLKDGHEVSGLVRRTEAAEELRQAGVTPYLGDLMEMSVEKLTEMIRGHDVIVFSAGAAGSGADRTRVIDFETPVNLTLAAQSSGINRIYLVSAFMDSLRGQQTSEGFEFYMKMKRAADNALVASGLDYVIVRPGTLVSEEGTGLVNLDRAIDYGTVARGNVAAVLAELINTPQIKQEIIELTDGDIAVSEAVQNLQRR